MVDRNYFVDPTLPGAEPFGSLPLEDVEDALRRTRLIFGSAVALSISCFVLAASRFFLEGLPSNVGFVLLSTGIGFAIVPIILRFFGSTAISGTLVPVIGIVGVFGMAVAEAGLYSEALFWAPFIPLAAVLLAPRRTVLPITFVAFFSFFGILALQMNGSFGGFNPDRGNTADVLRTVGGAGAVLFGGVLGLLYERTRQHAQKHLWFLANHNQLTGLPGRTLFFNELRIALARRRPLPASVGLVLIDVDNLKQINDCFGHACGDVLLKNVADRLTFSTRESEMPCHLCGDEFTVILELDEPTSAKAAVDRIQEAIAQPFELDGCIVPVTASIGLAIAKPDESIESLLRRADSAMYSQKEASRKERSDS